MSVEDFTEAQDLIEIFFANGAMEYTDAAKFLQSLGNVEEQLLRDRQETYPAGTPEEAPDDAD